MDQLPDLSLILSVATIVASALAGLSLGNMKMLRDTRDDLRSRIEDLEKADARKSAIITRLESDNDFLTRALKGEVHWHELTETLDLHHGEAMKHWANDERLLEDICRRLERLERPQG